MEQQVREAGHNRLTCDLGSLEGKSTDFIRIVWQDPTRQSCKTIVLII